MKSYINIYVVLALSLPVTFLACSVDTSNAANGGPANTAKAPSVGGKCATVGPKACYCEDGNLNGTQTCNADGTVTPCVCPQSASGLTTTATASAADDGAVCADLQNKSGCTAQNYRSTELTANVLFVLDRSGSMACNPPPLQDSVSCENNPLPVDRTKPSKWQITVDALGKVFDGLLAKRSTANVGLTLFSNDNLCGVQSTPNVAVKPLTAAQVGALKQVLTQTVPSGSTPLVGATTLAYAYLHQEANSAPGCAEPCGARGNRFVVLITDGADACPSPSRPQDAAECTAVGGCTNYLVKKQAPTAAQSNIRTFVIGAPGSEPARGYLSELAYAGGTARNSGACSHDANANAGDCHFDMTTANDFATALASALNDVSGAALGCEFTVPTTGAPVTAGSVNVQYRSSNAAPVCFKYDGRDCATAADGWQFAKAANGTEDLSRVVICGQACATVRNDSAARVDVILGCDTIVLN